LRAADENEKYDDDDEEEEAVVAEEDELHCAGILFVVRPFVGSAGVA